VTPVIVNAATKHGMIAEPIIAPLAGGVTTNRVTTSITNNAVKLHSCSQNRTLFNNVDAVEITLPSATRSNPAPTSRLPVAPDPRCPSGDQRVERGGDGARGMRTGVSKVQGGQPMPRRELLNGAEREQLRSLVSTHQVHRYTVDWRTRPLAK
jgi:hypothetical protein